VQVEVAWGAFVSSPSIGTIDDANKPQSPFFIRRWYLTIDQPNFNLISVRKWLALVIIILADLAPLVGTMARFRARPEDLAVIACLAIVHERGFSAITIRALGSEGDVGGLRDGHGLYNRRWQSCNCSSRGICMISAVLVLVQNTVVVQYFSVQLRMMTSLVGWRNTLHLRTNQQILKQSEIVNRAFDRRIDVDNFSVVADANWRVR
jgi:hypothetical protein